MFGTFRTHVSFHLAARFLGVPAQSESPGRPLEIDEWSVSTWTNRWWLMMVNHRRKFRSETSDNMDS